MTGLARRLFPLTATAVLVLAAPAAAAPRTIEPLAVDAKPSPGAAFFRDRVIDRAPTAMAAAVTRGLITRRYRTPDGRSVEISISSSFPDVAENRAAAQSFAYFLATRTHGSELSGLRVFIGTDAEVNAICGGGAGVLACYERAARRMYVPDRDPRNGGPFTREYAVTHEYGHHVAGLRSHHPFPALSYGAKRWSSFQYVCARARAGQLVPGNQTDRYRDDPGEGFADTYAHLHYPSVIWQYAEILRPNGGSLAAVRNDVVAPWRGPQRRVIRGSLGNGVSVRGYALRQRLDGLLSFALSGPRGSRYDLLLVYRGQVVRQTRAPGSNDRMTVLSCRGPGVPTATLALRVVRRTGAGPFTLRTSVVG